MPDTETEESVQPVYREALGDERIKDESSGHVGFARPRLSGFDPGQSTALKRNCAVAIDVKGRRVFVDSEAQLIRLEVEKAARFTYIEVGWHELDRGCPQVLEEIERAFSQLSEPIPWRTHGEAK